MSAALRPLPERVLAALEGFEPEGNPTSDTYDDLYKAFETFNEALFGGVLDPVLISIRARKELGYFKENCFRHKDSRMAFAHEIALNAEQFGLHSIEMCLANLVRQMVHQHQYQRGTRGRRGYENKEFVALMERIGITVRKEEEGAGKGVYKEKHDDLLIHPDGPFMRVARQLIDEGFRARWADRFIESMREEFAQQQAQLEAIEAGEQAVQVGQAEGDQVALTEGSAGGEEEGSRLPGNATAEAVGLAGQGPAGDPICEGAAGSVVPPIEGAPITEAAIEFLAPPKPRDSKHKFQCPLCRDMAWAKATIKLVCGNCRVHMPRAEADGSHMDPKRIQRFRIDWKEGAGEGQGDAPLEATEGAL